MAPFFHRPERKNVWHFVLQDQIPLPFITDSRYDDNNSIYDQLEFEGGFSSVFSVEIHPEHHAFRKPDTQVREKSHHGTDFTFETREGSGHVFAIKCLLSRNRDGFKKEADTLRRFSDDTHDHLISLQATYEQFKRFYLIFPRAEGDLRDYWNNKNSDPSMDINTVHWVARQCSGIATGLAKIHRYESSHTKQYETTNKQVFGHHEDIKPENVLWFKDQSDMGTLKITDFGLAEFKVGHSTFARPKSRIAFSPSYRAPECDQGSNGTGRSSDIWALGCLYLELITWLLGGWGLLSQFHDVRKSLDPGWYDMKTDIFLEIPGIHSEGDGIPTIKPAVTQALFCYIPQ